MSDSNFWNVYAGLDSDDADYNLILQYDDDDQLDYEDYEDAVAVQAQLDGSRNNVHDLQSGSGQINANNSNHHQVETNEESILNGRMMILLMCFFVWILLRLIKRWKSRSSQSVDLPKYFVYPKD